MTDRESEILAERAASSLSRVALAEARYAVCQGDIDFARYRLRVAAEGAPNDEDVQMEVRRINGWISGETEIGSGVQYA